MKYFGTLLLTEEQAYRSEQFTSLLGQGDDTARSCCYGGKHRVVAINGFG